MGSSEGVISTISYDPLAYATSSKVKTFATCDVEGGTMCAIPPDSAMPGFLVSFGSQRCIGSGSFNFRWAERDGFDRGYAGDLHTVRRYTCCEASVGIIIIIIEGFYPNVP